MIGFWDQVICDQESIIVLKSGNSATSKCDGVMLPIEQTTENDKGNHTVLFWKCSQCGREVR